MTNIVLSLILCQLIPLVIGDQKCYTNETFLTGEPEICINENPFCCFDISGQYYCCEENQTLTIIRSTTIVFGIIFLLTFIIVIFGLVFIDFQRLTEATVEVIPPEKNTTEETDTKDDGFSALFDTQTLPDKETVVTEEKTEKTETKPKSQDNYKPDWGQPSQKVESKSSATKIGFKSKRPSTVKSVDKLKDSINKSKSKSGSKKSSKASSKKGFNKNVEKLTKTLNK